MESTGKIKKRFTKGDFPTDEDKKQIVENIKKQMENYRYGFNRWIGQKGCLIWKTDYKMIMTCMKILPDARVFPEHKVMLARLGKVGYWVRMDELNRILARNYPRYKRWVYAENLILEQAPGRPIPLIGDFDFQYFFI